MKDLIFALLFLGASVPAFSQHGPTTLTWGAQQQGSNVCLTNGAPLVAGGIVRLGFFDLAPAEIKALFSHPEVLITHFTTLATNQSGGFGGKTFIGAPELDLPSEIVLEALGCFASSVVLAPTFSQPNSEGQRCYLWAMNGATVESSTQHGIFSNHDWILSSNSLGATIWDLSQVSPTDPSDLILGHRGPQISVLAGGTVLRLTDTNQLKLDEADDDHDGAPGLLEEAFAMNAAKADSNKLPKLNMVGSAPALAFYRRPGGVTAADGSYTAAGLRYTIEVSGNLSSWTPCEAAAAPVLEIGPIEDGAEKVTVSLAPSTNGPICKFARVRVERVE